MKKSILLFLLIPLYLFSQEFDTFIDSRDSIVYKIVKIGDQWWMAENLRFDIPKSLEGASDQYRIIINDRETNTAYVLTHISSNYDDSLVPTYGYLYSKKAACEACPAGWHLPNDNEWVSLILQLGGFKNAGTAMKEAGDEHWKSVNRKTPATNSSGFTAVPAGFRSPEGRFEYFGTMTRFWGQDGYSYTLGYKKSIGRYRNTPPLNFYSVRCIKD